MALFRYIVLIIFSATLWSCTKSLSQEDKLHIDNMQSVFKLRSEVDKLWPGFNDPKYNVPLVYYTDSVCYAINPSDKFKKLYDTELLLSENMLKYYKTKRIDTITFHMHISTVFDDESKFNYFESYMAM